MQRVPSYRRRIMGRWHQVDGYTRPDRPNGKKRMVEKRPMTKLYPVRDEYGQFHGYRRRK